jgi:hypothetical protein
MDTCEDPHQLKTDGKNFHQHVVDETIKHQAGIDGKINYQSGTDGKGTWVMVTVRVSLPSPECCVKGSWPMWSGAKAVSWALINQ